MDRDNAAKVAQPGLKTVTVDLEEAVYSLRTYVKYGNTPVAPQTESLLKETEPTSEIERLTRRLMDVVKAVKDIRRSINLE